MSALTEEEARKCWCPFSRVIERNESGTTRARNRVAAYDHGILRSELSDGLGGATCIASKCMAWRWVFDPTYSDGGAFRSGSKQSTKGYCGMAGQP